MSYILTLGSSEPDKLREMGLNPDYNYAIIDTGNAKDLDGKNQ